MPVKVFKTGDEIIQVDYLGDVNVDELKVATTEVKKITDELKRIGKKALFLLNLTDLVIPDSEERDYLFDTIDTFPYDKVAAYGGPKPLLLLAKLIIKVSQRDSLIMAFETKEQAVAWLKS